METGNKEVKTTKRTNRASRAKQAPELPEVTQGEKPVEHTENSQKELPEIGNSENVVIIGGNPVEIKPTKLRYQRDRTATFYKALEYYPIVDILATDVGGFDEERSGDKCLMDWLIAVTDDSELIVENYNSMDSEQIEKMLIIFKRVNRIEEKEQKAKNLRAEREGAMKA